MQKSRLRAEGLNAPVITIQPRADRSARRSPLLVQNNIGSLPRGRRRRATGGDLQRAVDVPPRAPPPRLMLPPG